MRKKYNTRSTSKNRKIESNKGHNTLERCFKDNRTSKAETSKQKTESHTEEEDTTSLNNMESNEGADAILEHRIELKINKML